MKIAVFNPSLPYATSPRKTTPTFPDLSAAEALRLQLEHHGVPTRVESRALEAGLQADALIAQAAASNVLSP